MNNNIKKSNKIKKSDKSKIVLEHLTNKLNTLKNHLSNNPKDHKTKIALNKAGSNLKNMIKYYENKKK